MRSASPSPLLHRGPSPTQPHKEALGACESPCSSPCADHSGAGRDSHDAHCRQIQARTRVLRGEREGEGGRQRPSPCLVAFSICYSRGMRSSVGKWHPDRHTRRFLAGVEARHVVLTEQLAALIVAGASFKEAGQALGLGKNLVTRLARRPQFQRAVRRLSRAVPNAAAAELGAVLRGCFGDRQGLRPANLSFEQRKN